MKTFNEKLHNDFLFFKKADGVFSIKSSFLLIPRGGKPKVLACLKATLFCSHL